MSTPYRFFRLFGVTSVVLSAGSFAWAGDLPKTASSASPSPSPAPSASASPLASQGSAKSSAGDQVEKQIVTPAVIPTIALSELIQKPVWTQKELDRTLGRTVAWSKIVQEQAKEFIALRRGRMSPRQKLLWVAECLSHPGENVFCEFGTDKRAEKKKSERTLKAARLRADANRIRHWISDGNLKELNRYADGPIQRAFRGYDRWKDLSKITQASLAAEECPSADLLTSLGLKAEEFLPDAAVKKDAIQLYAKAVKCGKSNETLEKARYRLSLLLIWDNDCKQADPHLLKLSENRDGDFTARSLYWRSHCAQESGNKLLQAAMRERLLKEYPLSYHGLLMSGRRNADTVRVLEQKDTQLQLRSKKDPSVNAAIEAAEQLLVSGAPELAQQVLESAAPKLEEAEIPLRLYSAYLIRGTGNMIGQFRMLAGIFKDDTGALSRSTLQLYYPLRRFDVMSNYRAKVDPYLVAALIRQESGFNERARSPVGALGLMQLMPRTARHFERVSHRELMDARTNIRLGIRYFQGLMSRFKGDAELALAAYNAGPERVDDWQKRYTTDNRILFLDLIPFTETRNYVALIARNYYWYVNLYGEPGPVSRNPASQQLVSFKNKPSLFSSFSRADVL